MANVYNNNLHNLRLQVNMEEYWDFFLNKDDYVGKSFSDRSPEDCLISYIDTDDPDCILFDELFSKEKYYWNDLVISDITLKNIGYTGVDNGFISFEKDKITNEEFLKLYTGSTYTISSSDKRFKLKQVTGNTMVYDYPAYTVFEDENNFQSIKLNGGFYQGFFKLYGYDYQLFPTDIEGSWTFHFKLKRKEFEKGGERKTLNEAHPDNKGIFFFIGTRAENKWFTSYTKSDSETFEKINNNSYSDEGYVDESYETSNDEIVNNVSYTQDAEIYKDKPVEPYVMDGYLTESCDYNGSSNENVTVEYIEEFYQYTENECDKLCKLVPNPYWLNYYHSFYDCGTYRFPKPCNDCCDNDNYLNTCCCDICKDDCDCGKTFVGTTGYFANDYLENNSYIDLRRNNDYVLDDYLQDDKPIDENMELVTEDGFPLDRAHLYEFETDNKFITFNRTETGFTTYNFDENVTVVLTGQTMSKELPNYHTLFNRTETGYTTYNIEPIIRKYNNIYRVYDDIRGNAFALRIKDDGSIGYRYMVLDCDKENNIGILEEYSLPNIIRYNTWHEIAVRLKMNTSIDIKCPPKLKKRKMKLYFYVDGKLKFISKELPEFNFRALDEIKEKQEGVPYNISIGGGTQGLCDMITLNYYKLPEYILPLEKYFAGTFIGEFKEFKFYDCFNVQTPEYR